MSANSFGQRLVITTFGESHGPALGVVVDGCPSGIPFDTELLRQELNRRKPGGVTASGESITSARAESDEPEILSGVYQGRSLGTPIAMLVRNQDARSQDYATIAEQPRVGHADDVWRAKFGHSDPRGGGRSSGRETVSRVMAGAVAPVSYTHLDVYKRQVMYQPKNGIDWRTFLAMNRRLTGTWMNAQTMSNIDW